MKLFIIQFIYPRGKWEVIFKGRDAHENILLNLRIQAILNSISEHLYRINHISIQIVSSKKKPNKTK